VTGDVTHALKAEGADASEDGTGRGTPIIAFSGKDYGADAGEVSPPLRAMGHDSSHQNGGGQVAIAFHPTQDPISSIDGTTHAMGTGSKQGTATIAITQGPAVRRLTPRECERLQGWPDDHTAIPRGKHGKVMQDGPRYKIIGNGWALPCVQWIGRRIVNQIEKA
jgi:DNA (cytosine-5)-methyltransferase 1